MNRLSHCTTRGSCAPLRLAHEHGTLSESLLAPPTSPRHPTPTATRPLERSVAICHSAHGGSSLSSSLSPSLLTNVSSCYGGLTHNRGHDSTLVCHAWLFGVCLPQCRYKLGEKWTLTLPWWCSFCCCCCCCCGQRWLNWLEEFLWNLNAGFSRANCLN